MFPPTLRVFPVYSSPMSRLNAKIGEFEEELTKLVTAREEEEARYEAGVVSGVGNIRSYFYFLFLSICLSFWKYFSGRKDCKRV